jgi:hypothetical protein
VPVPDPQPLFREVRAPVRPWPVTAVCLAGGLLLLGTWLHAARGSQARAFGPGYWIYLVVTTGALAVALLGLWWSKRWALLALPAALMLDDGVVAAMGELRWGVVVVQLGVVGTVLLATVGRARR